MQHLHSHATCKSVFSSESAHDEYFRKLITRLSLFSLTRRSSVTHLTLPPYPAPPLPLTLLSVFIAFNPVTLSLVRSRHRFECHPVCLSPLPQSFVRGPPPSIRSLSASPVIRELLPHFSHSLLIFPFTSLSPCLPAPSAHFLSSSSLADNKRGSAMPRFAGLPPRCNTKNVNGTERETHNPRRRSLVARALACSANTHILQTGKYFIYLL